MQELLQRYPGITPYYLTIAMGDVFTRPTAVSTILGSCVAVTFFCPLLKLGATFHALMPSWGSAEQPKGNLAYRFVDQSILRILDTLTRMGVAKRALECKVFGGANVMFQGEVAVGRRNVEAALKTLASQGLRVLSTDVGGTQGRKLIFITSTGEVFVRRLGQTFATNRLCAARAG